MKKASAVIVIMVMVLFLAILLATEFVKVKYGKTAEMIALGAVALILIAWLFFDRRRK